MSDITNCMQTTTIFVMAGSVVYIGPRHMLVEVMLKSVRVNVYFCHEVALTLVRDTLIFA